MRTKTTNPFFVKRRELGLCAYCDNPIYKNGVCCIVCRKRINERVKKSNMSVRDEVYKHYGNICACCGETESKFLSIDHVNNDGAKHRKEIWTSASRRSSGSHLYRWIIKNNYPDGFQLLCMNCNHGKSRNDGICPHKTASKISNR